MNGKDSQVPITPYSDSTGIVYVDRLEDDAANAAQSATLNDYHIRQRHGYAAHEYFGAELVRNPDGSPLLDHENKPIPIAKMLATKPLRSELLTRPGPGNRKLTYLSGDSVTRTLNDVFGFDGWCLEVKETRRESCEKDEKNRHNVSYTALVRVTHRQSGAFKEDCGAGDSTDRSLATAVSHALKASVTDAMKRAVRHFGDKLGNSLYESSFSQSKAPVSLKDALIKYEIERAKSKFGFEKDRLKPKGGTTAKTITGTGTSTSGSGSGCANTSSSINSSAAKPVPSAVAVSTPAAKPVAIKSNATSNIQQYNHRTPKQQNQSSHHQNPARQTSVLRTNTHTNSTSVIRSTPVLNSSTKQTPTNPNVARKNVYNTSHATNIYNTNKTMKNVMNKTPTAMGNHNLTAHNKTPQNNQQNEMKIPGLDFTLGAACNTAPRVTEKSPNGMPRFQQSSGPKPKETATNPYQNSVQTYRQPPASAAPSSMPPFANRQRPSQGSNGAQTLHLVAGSSGQRPNALSDITFSSNATTNPVIPPQNLNGKRTIDSALNNSQKKMTPYRGSNPYSTSKK